MRVSTGQRPRLLSRRREAVQRDVTRPSGDVRCVGVGSMIFSRWETSERDAADSNQTTTNEQPSTRRRPPPIKLLPFSAVTSLPVPIWLEHQRRHCTWRRSSALLWLYDFTACVYLEPLVIKRVYSGSLSPGHAITAALLAAT